MDRKKLMIIDGSSLIYRAFYALPLLSTKEGIYTNGIYGFLTMLYKIKEEQKPDYICVAFDKKGPTFRHEEYDKYKGNRQATPSELVQQFPIIREILDAMNIKYLELSGFEADDIAGTLAKIGEENSIDVILVTGDKDYLQLATDNTKVFITRKGITELEIFDRNIIIDKYGITPDQLIELKGLMGDQSDNIPGVPGIGEKTGLKLLKEYGTIENIYENIDNISGKKLKENLIENKHLAFLSRKLGEIMTRVPLNLEFEELKIEDPNLDDLIKLYESLEFNSLLQKVTDGYLVEEELHSPLEFNIINQSKYGELVNDIKKIGKFAFKCIVSDSNYIEDKIIAIGMKTCDSLTNIIYLDNHEEEFVNSFGDIFRDVTIEKIGHNLKSDIVILSRLDIEVENIRFDSMISQYLINPAQNTYSINDISKEYLDYYGVDEESLLGKGKNKRKINDLDQEEIGEYISFILDTVLNVEVEMQKILEEQEMLDLYYNVELPLVQVLGSMEYYGFKINLKVIGEIIKELSEKKTISISFK